VHHVRNEADLKVPTTHVGWQQTPDGLSRHQGPPFVRDKSQIQERPLVQGAIWTLLRLDNGQRGTPTRFMGKEEGNRVLHAPVLRCGDERNLFQKAHQEGTLRLIKPQKKGKMIIAGNSGMA